MEYNMEIIKTASPHILRAKVFCYELLNLT